LIRDRPQGHRCHHRAGRRSTVVGDVARPLAAFFIMVRRIVTLDELPNQRKAAAGIASRHSRLPSTGTGLQVIEYRLGCYDEGGVQDGEDHFLRGNSGRPNV
jgi:hypothetical protein